MTEKIKSELPEEVLKKIIEHIMIICDISGMELRLILDAKDKESAVGFVLADKGVFNGEIETVEDDLTWAGPERPKHLN